RQRRKYPNYGAITGYAADGSTSYNAMQLMVSRRFGARFQMNGHYVWSKSLGNADGSFWGYAPDRDASSWARTSTDRRHSAVWNGFVELPSIFARSKFGRLASGWKASAIV